MTHSTQHPLLGHNRRFTLTRFPARRVTSPAPTRIKPGLIVVLPFLPKTIGKNGKSSIIANVVKSGGLGAATDRPQNSAVETMNPVAIAEYLMPSIHLTTSKI